MRRPFLLHLHYRLATGSRGVEPAPYRAATTRDSVYRNQRLQLTTSTSFEGGVDGSVCQFACELSSNWQDYLTLGAVALASERCLISSDCRSSAFFRLKKSSGMRKARSIWLLLPEHHWRMERNQLSLKSPVRKIQRICRCKRSPATRRRTSSGHNGPQGNLRKAHCELE